MAEQNKLQTQNNEVSDETNEVNSWDDIKGLHKNILRGIYGNGFEKPSPIQRKAIIPLLEKKDIIAQAQSGTGKTGCFGIGMISLINTDSNNVQGIILAPTRELASQINDVVVRLSVYIKNLRTQVLIGGTSANMDKFNMDKIKPQLVIGCPGKINDMLRRNFLNTSHIKIIILDEADEMLSLGFKEQVYNVFQYMPNDVQVGLFSATMPVDLLQLSEKFMRDPVKVLVKAEMLSLEGISQYYIALDGEQSEIDHIKVETLKDLFGDISVSLCIIYCNSVKRAEDLYTAMLMDNFAVCCIHSNMDKDKRTQNFNNFKNGKYRVLISTNVTARGIDIQQVSTVINFDVPNSVETYLHRIGRSGRWGRKGYGINFMTKKDVKYIKQIEEYYHTQIKELPNNWSEI